MADDNKETIQKERPHDQKSVRSLRDFYEKDHTMKFARLHVAAALMALAFIPTTHASQSSGCVPTTGRFNGLEENTAINAANAAFISMNSGATAPATDCSGVPVKGQSWLNTSVNSVNLYDGLNWLYLGVMDTVNHIWKPVVGGGVETLASAGTTDVCSVAGSAINISGTATITSLGSSCTPGSFKMLVFTGTPTLTYSSSLSFQGGLPITASAGDTALALYLGGGNWKLNYNQASGQALVNPTVEVGTIQFTSAFSLPSSGKYVFGAGQAISRASFPDFLAAVTRTQNGVRTSGSPTLTSVPDTSGMGVGMPVEGPGIPAATTIASVTSNTITMSANASSSGTNTVTVFSTGYGAGGSTSTVGVPDCRGRVMAGRDNMNGTAAGRLSSVYFGTSASAINAGGGVESASLGTTNLPPYTPSGAITNGAIHNTVSGGIYGGTGFIPRGSSSSADPTGPALIVVTSTQDTSTFTGNANGGSSAPFSITQPTVIANCIVRVLTMNFPQPEPANNDNKSPAVYERRFG